MESFELRLNLAFKNHIQILRSIKLLKLPPISRIRLNRVSDSNSDLLEFFQYSLPDKLNFLTLNLSFHKIVNLDFYADALACGLGKVTRNVFFGAFKFSEKAFETILKACKNTHTVNFYRCIIDIEDELNFTESEYKISILSFSGSGLIPENSWDSHRDKLIKIIKAISECRLKNSLTEINLAN